MKVTNCLTTHYVDTEALDRDNITADERPDTIIMGATGWSYFVPYEANIATALERLRQDGFTRGDYVFGVGLSAKLIEESMNRMRPGFEAAAKDLAAKAEDTNQPVHLRAPLLELATRLEEMRNYKAGAARSEPKANCCGLF